jgi:hypothetical protein
MSEVQEAAGCSGCKEEGVMVMGLFSSDKKRDNKDRIKELRGKIEILEQSGMVASADRLKKQLAMLENTHGDAVQEKYDPGYVKKKIKEAKATGQMK